MRATRTAVRTAPQDLLQRLLTKDACARATLEQLKAHAWVTQDGVLPPLQTSAERAVQRVFEAMRQRNGGAWGLWGGGGAGVVWGFLGGVGVGGACVCVRICGRVHVTASEWQGRGKRGVRLRSGAWAEWAAALQGRRGKRHTTQRSGRGMCTCCRVLPGAAIGAASGAPPASVPPSCSRLLQHPCFASFDRPRHPTPPASPHTP